MLSVNTKNVSKKNLENIFDFSNLDENHELFSNKNIKDNGKLKIETTKIIWIDKFVCLRSKMYAFKCGNDSENKLKGVSISYSKNIKFEEYYNCLFKEEYQQECDIFIIRSLNQEMHLQQIKKSTLSVFDDKRYYIKETERIPWN